MHARGTVVVIHGPRFSTRAESRWYRAQGWDVVNMTQYPEAYLARELGMHYAGIALVTDYDTGVEDDPGVEPVTRSRCSQFFEENVHHVRALLDELMPAAARGSARTALRAAAPSARCRARNAERSRAKGPWPAGPGGR